MHIEEKRKKEKVVFFGTNHKTIKPIYEEIIHSPNIEYVCLRWDYRKGRFNFPLTRPFLKVMPTFILKIAYKRFFDTNFFRLVSKRDDALFIFCHQFLLYEDYLFIPFIKALKRIYPRSKLCFYYNDLIGTRGNYEFEIMPAMKKLFDLLITHDITSAEKYDLEYYGDVNSRHEPNNETVFESTDVFYAGSCHQRFDNQLRVFKKLSDLPLHNVFFLVGLTQDERKKIKGVLTGGAWIDSDTYEYKSSTLHTTFLHNEVVLSYTRHCKCLAEFMTGNAHGSTTRFSESVMYQKKILTNNQSIRNHPAYCENNVLVFDDICDIPDDKLLQFVLSPGSAASYDFSPVTMVNYIKSKLFTD